MLETSYTTLSDGSISHKSGFKVTPHSNMRKIHDLESLLGTKRSLIVEFANQFMIQIAVFEHPMNDFEGMDEKIYQGMIMPKVKDII